MRRLSSRRAQLRRHGPPVDQRQSYQVGEELDSDGTWTNTPTAYAYQWQRCDIDATNCLPDHRCDQEDLQRPERRSRFPAARQGHHPRCEQLGSALSAVTAIVVPTVAVTNKRPTLTVDLGVQFLGARVREVPDLRRHLKNLTILAVARAPPTPRDAARFSTLIARPRAASTPQLGARAAFPRQGRYTITLQARDTSGLA